MLVADLEVVYALVGVLLGPPLGVAAALGRLTVGTT